MFRGNRPLACRYRFICFVRFAFLLDVAAHHEDRQERQDKGHHEDQRVIGGGQREQNARYGASEGPSHALCRGVPSKRRGDHLLATVLGKKRVEGWITHRLRHSVRGPEREQLPRGADERQSQRYSAAKSRGRGETALQAKAVSHRAHQRFERHRDHEVDRGEDPDLRELHPQVIGIERQGKADQAEAEAGKETLRDDGQ